MSNQRKTKSAQILITAITIASISLFAEKINGPANIRNEVNGPIVGNINDQENVNADWYGPNNKWFNIEADGYILKSDNKPTRNRDITLDHDVVLFNKNGNPIGNLKKGAYFFGTDDTSRFYHGIVIAKTSAKNIEPSSITEVQFDSLIAKNAITTNDYLEFLQHNKFKIWMNKSDWKLYLKESPDSPGSPGIRILLGFLNDSLSVVISENPKHISSLKFNETVGPNGRDTIAIISNRKSTEDNFKKQFYKTLQEAN